MEGKMKIAVVEDEKVHAAVLTGFLEAWLKENQGVSQRGGIFI